MSPGFDPDRTLIAEPVTKTSPALDKLRELARALHEGHPELTPELAFAKTYSDPANRALASAERAENRPGIAVERKGGTGPVGDRVHALAGSFNDDASGLVTQRGRRGRAGTQPRACPLFRSRTGGPTMTSAVRGRSSRRIGGAPPAYPFAGERCQGRHGPDVSAIQSPWAVPKVWENVIAAQIERFYLWRVDRRDRYRVDVQATGPFPEGLSLALSVTGNC
jgi:hypothetical protein